MEWATYDDYLLRYPSDASESENTVKTRLGDVSALITSKLDAAGVDYSTLEDADGNETALRHNLRTVTCAVLSRSLRTAAAAGISQESQMVGQLQQSYTYANPLGNLYLTNDEKSLLGISEAEGRGTQLFYSGQEG